MQLIKKYILSLMHLIIGIQKTIKVREYVKGLYRYPSKMIGRNLSINKLNQTDILIFATHPDDEVLGLSAVMKRHCLHGDKVTVVYVTDGTGRDGDSWRRKKELSEKIAKTRYREGIRGLSILNIPQQNLICLGFPDGGTHRYLKEMSKDVISLMLKLSPKRVYVHCVEGGHNDHDLVSIVVKSVCNMLNFPNIYEWAIYSTIYPLGTKDMNFLPSLSFHKAKVIKIKFSDDEINTKRKMLECHVSQNVANMFTQGEILREANIKHLEEELMAYSQVLREEWGYLVERYLLYMKNVKQNKLLKINSQNKQIVRKI